MDRRLQHELLMTCFSKEELATMYLKRLEELAQSNLIKDAALADLKAVGSCRSCANYNKYGVCSLNYSKCEWKWRGDI